MKDVTPNNIPEGLKVFEIRKFGDDRGKFWELFHNTTCPIDEEFVQDNAATSQKDVLRGLHFQNPPYDQGKLVQVIQGSVLDVVVDIRKESPTYGQYFSIELTATNNLVFWVPSGFAHGYRSLEDNTIFHYKCTNHYHPASEGGLMWNDPDLNIDWGNPANPIISDKDKINSNFAEFKSLF